MLLLVVGSPSMSALAGKTLLTQDGTEVKADDVLSQKDKIALYAVLTITTVFNGGGSDTFRHTGAPLAASSLLSSRSSMKSVLVAFRSA